jgi:hypothetical protein
MAFGGKGGQVLKQIDGHPSQDVEHEINLVLTMYILRQYVI